MDVRTWARPDGLLAGLLRLLRWGVALGCGWLLLGVAEVLLRDTLQRGAWQGLALIAGLVAMREGLLRLIGKSWPELPTGSRDPVRMLAWATAVAVIAMLQQMCGGDIVAGMALAVALIFALLSGWFEAERRADVLALLLAPGLAYLIAGDPAIQPPGPLP